MLRIAVMTDKGDAVAEKLKIPEATRLVSYLKGNLSAGNSLAGRTVCNAIGINRKSLSKMLEKNALQNALARIGVHTNHKCFEKTIK
ncbi:hypothetical protein ACU5AX_02905 [Sphingomonas sp. XXL09]|uniref:hypothetical protein n=1 Tax=Sphingomonas sp. XXL09 TaxID=3457787 RepID=UPI00406BA0E5